MSATVGLQVMATMLEDERTRVCGPIHAKLADRTATRGGTTRSSVVLGGRKVPVDRPRARKVDGTGEVESEARSTSKSTVSRRWVRGTKAALDELLGRDLPGLDVAVLMIDGVHFADVCCVVCMVILADGTKVPVGVRESDTENATLVRELLADQVVRGLSAEHGLLVVIDGAKALASGV